MKNSLVVLLLTAAALAGQTSASPATTAPKAKSADKATPAKSPAPQPVTIPADAKANPDGTYTWTDKAGKTWRYVKSPFGIIRSEANAAPEAPSTALAGVKAFDAGDKIQFERTTPFGPLKWEKNKSELTDEERGLVKSQLGDQNAK